LIKATGEEETNEIARNQVIELTKKILIDLHGHAADTFNFYRN